MPPKKKNKEKVKVKAHTRGSLKISGIGEVISGKPFVQYPTKVKSYTRRKPKKKK